MAELDDKPEPQLVELDDGKYIVTKDEDGKDIAVPVDDSFALAEIKKAEATIVAEHEKTSRTLVKHKTDRLEMASQMIVILAIIATCALT